MTTMLHPQGRGLVRAICFGLALFGGVIGMAGFLPSAAAQEAQWIWTPEQPKDQIPVGSVHFRKTFSLRAPESGSITIAADDTYELRVNGRAIGTGGGWKKLVEYDVSRFLARGKNIIAIKVTNTRGSTAGLAVRVMVKEDGGKWTSFSTDHSWKTSTRPLPLWDTSIYNDSRWDDAAVFGQLGQTVPWDRAEEVAKEETSKSERFNISDEFTVQMVVDGEQTGSLIAMAFNEFGQVIASKEGGPLLLLHDSDRDGNIDKSRVLCDKIKSAQGILALNGEVFVTADGPVGAALYRLSDKDRDGKLESVTPIIKFKGPMGEHGPHGIVLGSDGLIYVVVGNLSSLDGEYEASSPHKNYYEGDLVPRYEDPGGHAVGIKAPGGVVLRTDIEGSSVQLFAGGLRNVYDLVLNRDGEIFAHDSDMETDEGMPWFRPTQLFHVTHGSDLGWRSGWTRFPEYFLDNLPPILDTGRGSPTGGVAYNHHAFPTRYHNALFLADWSQGRILAVHLKSSGGSYKANSEVFLEGNPLNVTDVDVGPDGCLYFVTGGRGTSGGLFRVRWKGKVPPEVANLGEGITAVIRQPQLHSAWSRQRIAKLKNELGDKWDAQLEGVARSTANPPYYRSRALDVMQLFGPPPATTLLVDLSQDKNEAVRAKAADLMGLHFNEKTYDRLVALLSDSDRNVRRKACEALLRADQPVPFEDLIPSLTSDDRFESWAARRLLERLPIEEWREKVLTTKNQRALIEGSLALMIADPSKRNANDCIERLLAQLDSFISDRNFVDLLRVVEVAVHRAQLAPEELTTMRDRLGDEYPSGDPLMNRELVRLLTYTQSSFAIDRFLKFLKSDAPLIEKFHLAVHMRFIESGWKDGQALQLIEFLEKSNKPSKESNLPLYLSNITRDFARTLTEDESRQVLAQGSKWPHAALGALYKLPAQLDASALEDLKKLDRAVSTRTDEIAKPLRVGVIAVLARSGDVESMAYLREIWRRDPERRPVVAMGLAQQPDGENWNYLVRSLGVIDGPSAVEVLGKLTTVDEAPEEPEYYRQVILRGLSLKENGATAAIALLEHWAESPVSKPGDSWDTALTAWQKWFRESYPNLPDPKLPEVSEDSKWKFEELLEFLTTGDGLTSGSSTKGALAFHKAQCVKCHRFGDRGERMGPDLSAVSKRFTRKEILESIMYPSHVISDQFASKTVITTKGRKYTGIVTNGAGGEKIILQANGDKISIREEEIDDVIPNKTSAMPAGLLNNLSREEIADLFAYMGVAAKESVVRKTFGEPKK